MNPCNLNINSPGAVIYLLNDGTTPENFITLVVALKLKVISDATQF